MQTTKQIGDACEMLVAAYLTLAGMPAALMPDGWPHYDLIAQPPNGEPQRISVKARCRSARASSTHTFHFELGNCDWIAFVFLPQVDVSMAGSEMIWIVPTDVARDLSLPDGTGHRLPLAHLLAKFGVWKGNFTLTKNPSEVRDL
jgi:hypothetical protein